MYKFSYFASSKASPHTRYRMGQDFCITPYFIYAYSSLFNQTIAKIVELLWDLSAFSNYKIWIFAFFKTWKTFYSGSLACLFENNEKVH